MFQAALSVPLATRLRPITLAGVLGQDHLLGADQALGKIIDNNHL